VATDDDDPHAATPADDADAPVAADAPAVADTLTAGDAARGGLDNLRARDAVTASPDQLASQLSATELEQLSRWFGLPSFTQLAEDGPPPDSAPAVADVSAFDDIFASIPGFYIAPEEIKRTLEARQRAHAAVEPAMIAHLERHLGAGDALLRFHPDLELHIAPERFERRFVTRAAVDVTEVPMPEWMADALSHNVPQALLRDLHRPEYERQVDEGDPFTEPEPPFDPLGDVRAAVATRYHFASVEHGLPVARDGLAELAEVKASRWSEIKTPNRRVTE
jgi:hypothetical protein